MESGKTASSELNDPLSEQERASFLCAGFAAGRRRCPPKALDVDYIRAQLLSRHAPTAGEGIGHRPPDDAADGFALDP